MVVTSQILINKPREGVHKPGKPVTGIVKYVVDEPTAYKEVTLSFLGKGVCNWSESSGNSSTYYHGSEDYVTRHVNLTNKRPEESITLHGVYEHPFEFYLPEDVPTSYKDNTGSITYIIQLKFVKPNFFSFKKVFTAEIPVYGPVSTSTTAAGTPAHDGPVIFGVEKSLFTLFAIKKAVVNLKAEIAKTCLTPGENVHLSYVVTNHTSVVIPSVSTELYCYITYTANCGGKKKNVVKVKRCEVATPQVSEMEVGHFTCVLPTLPELYSIQNSNVISKEYKVRVTVRLPAPHVNARVEMPIAIGERRDSLGIDMGVEAYDDGEQPPSYWEAMYEEKVTEEVQEKLKEKE